MELKEIVWESVDWIDLAHDRNMLRAVRNAVLNTPFFHKMQEIS